LAGTHRDPPSSPTRPSPDPVQTGLSGPGTELEVELYGERCRAVVQEDRPLGDGDNELLRA
ncbi:MAG: hypothetical protein AB3N23_17110, partial [Paracoccaceae bacterium]